MEGIKPNLSEVTLNKVKRIMKGRLIETQFDEGNLVVIKDGDFRNAVVLDCGFSFRFSKTGLHIWDKNNLIGIQMSKDSIFEETDLGFNIDNYIVEVM